MDGVDVGAVGAIGVDVVGCSVLEIGECMIPPSDRRGRDVGPMMAMLDFPSFLSFLFFLTF